MSWAAVHPDHVNCLGHKVVLMIMTLVIKSDFQHATSSKTIMMDDEKVGKNSGVFVLFPSWEKGEIH